MLSSSLDDASHPASTLADNNRQLFTDFFVIISYNFLGFPEFSLISYNFLEFPEFSTTSYYFLKGSATVARTL